MFNTKSNIERFGLVLLGLLFVALLVNRLFLITSFTTDLQGIETTFVYYIQLFLQGRPIYYTPNEFPFFLNQYAPLSTYLVGFSCKILNVASQDVREIYLIGRSLNLIFNIATGLFVFRLLRKLDLHILVTSLVSVLVFAHFSLHHFAIRPDSLKTLFFTVSLYHLVSYYKKQLPRHLILLILFSALCVYTKQDGILIVAISCFSIFYWFGYKKTISYLFPTLALCLVMWLLVWNSFEEFYLNIFVGLNQGLNFEYFKLISPSLGNIFLYVLILLVLIAFFKNRKTSSLEKAIVFSTLFVFVLSLVASLKWGSSNAYFIEFVILFLIVLAQLYKQSNTSAKITFSLVGLALILQYGYLGYGFSWSIYNGQSEKVTMAEFKNSKIEATNLLALYPNNPIICLDKTVAPFFSETLIMGTYEAEFPNLMFCSPLYSTLPNQLFDYSNLDLYVQNNPTLLITDSTCESPNLSFEPSWSYDLIETNNHFKVYRISSI